MKNLLNHTKAFANKCFTAVKVYIQNHNRQIKALLFALANVFLIYYMLEVGNKNFALNKPLFIIINYLTVFVPVAAVYLFTQRWWISTLIVATPAMVLSVANNYTIMFRNSPISTQDIFNAQTALSVLDSYKLNLNFYIASILLIFIGIIFITVIIFRLEKGKKYNWKRILIKDICMVVFFWTVINVSYLGPTPLKPSGTLVWSWQDAYYKYGYTATSIEVLQTSLNMVTKPENYNEETLETEVTSNLTPKIGKNTPDIIYILNESFYDLRNLVDLGDTPSATPFIDSLPENQKGSVVVAGTGGGTNKSEYEFLTSNSVYLMSGITPFNFLNFNDANSIVKHLESQGYTTWAGHCAEPINYSRNKVYPLLGFDEIMFDKDFGEKQLYGSRYYATDSFCYGKMLESYENMGDEPRFMYLLTIQNHGNWDLNSDDDDLIKTSADFGEYTDDINEYLSCIKLSDMSFQALVQYFENCDRDVIICMVGDHGPSFAVNLVDEINAENTFKLRTTPYVIWANFPLDESVELPELTSMPYMTSMILDAANCTSSPFYNYMSMLRKDVPVLTAFGLYSTPDTVYSYGDDTPYRRSVDTYINMVFNNASPDANRNQNLFNPYK